MIPFTKLSLWVSTEYDFHFHCVFRLVNLIIYITSAVHLNFLDKWQSRL